MYLIKQRPCQTIQAIETKVKKKSGTCFPTDSGLKQDKPKNELWNIFTQNKPKLYWC